MKLGVVHRARDLEGYPLDDCDIVIVISVNLERVDMQDGQNTVVHYHGCANEGTQSEIHRRPRTGSLIREFRKGLSRSSYPSALFDYVLRECSGQWKHVSCSAFGSLLARQVAIGTRFGVLIYVGYQDLVEIQKHIHLISESVVHLAYVQRGAYDSANLHEHLALLRLLFQLGVKLGVVYRPRYLCADPFGRRQVTGGVSVLAHRPHVEYADQSVVVHERRTHE